MDQTRIKIVTVDGKEHEVVSTTYACLADRVAFEHTFNVPFAALGAINGMFQEDGSPTPGVDLLQAPRSEWGAFLVYRVAQRDIPAIAGKSFEQFTAEVIETDVQQIEPEPLDPTLEAQSAS